MSTPEKSPVSSETEPLKIVLAGDWHADIHEPAWARGLSQLGHEVVKFAWCDRFSKTGRPLDMLRYAQQRLAAGPLVGRLNADLRALVQRERPDVLLAYRGVLLHPKTFREIKRDRPATLIATYNNDDPFTGKSMWRHYLASLPWADVNMVYRTSTGEELRRRGARRVHLVRSAFLPEKDRPVELTADDRERFESDVTFAGHFEPDGRVDALRTVAAAGFRFRLFGPEWERAAREPWLRPLSPIRAIRGEDYIKGIAAAKIALCFLSTLNRDTYTRRCFEIPAIGTFLLCQRSEDMEAMFRPGLEADYFTSPSELVEKLSHYLEHDADRRRIAAAGQARVHAAGHDIYSRMREVDVILRDALRETRAIGLSESIARTPRTIDGPPACPPGLS